MKKQRDQEDLTIHDVQPISNDWAGHPSLFMSLDSRLTACVPVVACKLAMVVGANRVCGGYHNA